MGFPHHFQKASCPVCGKEFISASAPACHSCLASALALDLSSGNDSSETVEEFSDFGDYEVEGEIGRGGSGVVFKAWQKSLHRSVALKVLHPQFNSSPGSRQRFLREAASVAALHHPGIISVYETGETKGRLFFSMPWIEGRSLDRHVPEDPGHAARWVATIGRAIDHAHSKGMVHRDIKPSNCLIGLDGRIYVSDFGLSKMLDADSGLTATGELLGSPSYMAPEQISSPGSPPDVRVDVYGLGALFYHLLTGRPPFPGVSRDKTLLSVLHQDPVAPRLFNPLVPEDLENICLKCLEKAPARRYPSAAALVEDLDRFLEGRPVLARPVPPWQRVWRWSSRNPLASTLLLFLILGVIGLSHLGFRLSASNSSLARAWLLPFLATSEPYSEIGRPLEYLARASSLARRQPDVQSATSALLSMLTERSWALPLVSFGHPSAKPIFSACDSSASRLLTVDAERLLRVWNFQSGRLVHGPIDVGLGESMPTISPGGHWIAAVSTNGELKVLDAGTGKLVSSLPQSTQSTSLEFLWIDPNHLVSLHPGVGVRLWQFPAGSMLAHFPHDSLPFKLAMRGMEGDFLTVSTNGRVCGWNFRSPRKPSFQFDTDVQVQSISASADRSHIALITSSKAVRLFSLPSGRLIREFQHPNGISRACLSRDASHLAATVGTLASGVVVWRVGDGSRTALWPDAAEIPSDQPFAPKSGALMVRISFQEIRLVDPETGRMMVPPIPHENIFEHVGFAGLDSDSDRLLICNGGTNVYLYDLGLQRGGPPVGRHQGPVRAIEFSPDGSRILTASYDHKVRQWSFPDLKQVGPILMHSNEVVSARFDSTGERIVTSSRDSNVVVWSAKTGLILSGPFSHEAECANAIFSGDGRRVISTTRQGHLHFWDLSDGRASGDSIKTSQAIFSLWFPPAFLQLTPDGRFLLVGSHDSEAQIRDAAGGKLLHRLPVNGPLLAARLGRSGRFAATGSALGEVRLWDVRSGRPVTPPLQNPDAVYDLDISGDDQWLVVGCKEGACLLWRIADGSLAGRLDSNRKTMRTVRFSPQNNRFSAGSEDATIRVWDADMRLPASDLLRGHGHSVEWQAFHPSGLWLATGCRSGQLRIWRVYSDFGEPPGWFYDIVDSLAGQSFGKDDTLKPVTPRRLVELKHHFAAPPGPSEDPYEKWAGWFLGNRHFDEMFRAVHPVQ